MRYFTLTHVVCRNTSDTARIAEAPSQKAKQEKPQARFSDKPTLGK
jgi:hypothetical protein